MESKRDYLSGAQKRKLQNNGQNHLKNFQKLTHFLKTHLLMNNRLNLNANLETYPDQVTKGNNQPNLSVVKVNVM